MNELNKKLAERDKSGKFINGHMVDTISLRNKLNIWAGTKDIDFLCEESGLSACFKWLVPKLKESYTLQHIDYDMIRNQVLVWYWIRHRPKAPDEFTAKWGIDPNPALALCLAINKMIEQEIEKLIDEEQVK